MPVNRSMTRISLPSKDEPREYVDIVYKARLPFSLGIAGERRGVVMKALWLLSDDSHAVPKLSLITPM